MRLLPIILLLPLLSACIQSKHRGGGMAPPGGPLRLLEERPGNGKPVFPGDRVRVDFIGRYASGETWGEGPLTFIAGADAYPGAQNPVRVGATYRFQYLTSVNDTTVRLHPFDGGDYKNESFQFRRDRGPIIIEHTIRKVCRPMKLFIMHSGFGDIETDLGCWSLPRAAPRGPTDLERRISAIEGDNPPPDGKIDDPTTAARPPADTARYLGDDALHRAAYDGRPEIVGRLIARGRDPMAPDSFGFLPIHYVGWKQRPLERFVPALEQAYLDVLDTLLAHGVPVDAPVRPGRARGYSMPENEYAGYTTLAFAAPECADRLVQWLLERGASPNVMAAWGTVAIGGAAINGCPETMRLLIDRGADVNLDPNHTGSPIERLAAVSKFHQGHLACAEMLIAAGAHTATAAERLKDRLDDPGPGGFGFSNRPMARRILQLLRRAAP